MNGKTPETAGETRPSIISVACAHCGEMSFNIPLKGGCLHRLLCPKCKNPTYVVITEKLELQFFKEDELCPSCNGTGKCPMCKGLCKAICPICNGEGIYQSKFGGYLGCSDCGGSGYTEVVSDIDKNQAWLWACYVHFVCRYWFLSRLLRV